MHAGCHPGNMVEDLAGRKNGLSLEPLPVASRHATIVCTSGLQAEVADYSPDLPSQKIDIVDVAWAYDDPFSQKTYLFVACNALYIPAMGHNLIASMILQEAGLSGNEEVKHGVDAPTVNNHSIYDDDL